MDEAKSSRKEQDQIYNQYMFEKSSSMLESVARHIDFIEASKDDMKENIYAGAQFNLKQMLRYALLIAAYNGHTSNKIGYGFNPEHVQLILNKGIKGYERVIRVYSGAISHDIVTEGEFWEIFEQLLNGGRDNQTQIFELIRATTISNSYVDQLDDITEDVMMGNLTWDDYVQLVKNIKSANDVE